MDRRYEARGLLPLVLVAALLLVGGCASGGPRHAEIRQTLAQPDPGMGRIYFYRDSTPVGAAIQPDIRLNAQVVGSSKPGGFFFVDRSPGKYLVSLTTEVERTLEFELASGESRYVRTYISMGILVGRPNAELIHPSQGEAALSNLIYIGNPSLLARNPGPSMQPVAAPRSGVMMNELDGLLPEHKRGASTTGRAGSGLEDLKNLLPAE